MPSFHERVFLMASNNNQVQGQVNAAFTKTKVSDEFRSVRIDQVGEDITPANKSGIVHTGTIASAGRGSLVPPETTKSASIDPKTPRQSASGSRTSTTCRSAGGGGEISSAETTSAREVNASSRDAQSRHDEREGMVDNAGYKAPARLPSHRRTLKSLGSAPAGDPKGTRSSTLRGRKADLGHLYSKEYDAYPPLRVARGSALALKARRTHKRPRPRIGLLARFELLLSILLQQGISGALILLFLLNNFKCAAAFPTDTRAKEQGQQATQDTPGSRVQNALDLFWQTLFPIMPYVIFISGLVWVVCIARSLSRSPERRVYTWTLSTIVAIVWFAVRSRETTDAVEPVILTTTEATILMVFLAFWSGFAADSQRFLEHRALYLVLSAFVGGLGGVLIAALAFITTPKPVGANTVIDFEQQASNIIPLTLSVMSGVIYILLKRREDRAPEDEESQHGVHGTGIPQELGADPADHVAQNDRFTWRHRLAQWCHLRKRVTPGNGIVLGGGTRIMVNQGAASDSGRFSSSSGSVAPNSGAASATQRMSAVPQSGG
jgi:hypothetical protein